MYRRVIAIGSMILLVSCWALDMTPSMQAAQPHRKPPNTKNQKLEIPLTEDALIRFKKAPKQYDDKGKPIAPTEAQLKELKGDPKVPGYKAEFADLKQGQILEVRLGRPKKTTNGAGGEKPQWKTLTTITGRLARSNRRQPGAAKAAAKGQADTEPGLKTSEKLILETNIAALMQSGLEVSQGGQNLTLGNDIYAIRVMIVADVQPDKQKGN
jgi:hypothetical protein